MIRVQYFARYREVLGIEGEQLQRAALSNLEQLREHLQSRGGVWQVLAEQNLMCARNQELCSLDTEIADGDEIAFFPTVTGG
ncbi:MULTISPECIES: MoaD/ThiS family protein [Pseudomonadaceae]|jgi:molybdopterin synthase sulfur carrier subunit|uniref:Molybdopterin synthase sulfur carrier subunit n=1 Tax=Aquipseudomonas alcaligenes TaxID=43263 RepID=A0A1N6QLS9_AQUAC|nr:MULTISPECIES: MoaD/ThiS family protein [Pseudomonas]MDC7824139.1 MoaD/ThiS family protein [Pseudomonas sp. BLCC-B13]MDH1055047.1 MoaD/ThiS family protein [Pseudomonas alcaligenes]MEE1947820.1 MoaD/ThiS family protein [Pseudomonas alcaligenes]SIQ17535.1 molybdopterin synthase subunit MoaD [Pseudomonas alcaligenes]